MGFLGWFLEWNSLWQLLRLAPKLLVLFCASAHLCASCLTNYSSSTPLKKFHVEPKWSPKNLEVRKKIIWPIHTSMTFWGVPNWCWFSVRVQKGCILDFVFGRNGKEHSKGLKSQSRWVSVSLLSNDSKCLVGFVVPKSWLYAGSFQGSGRRCVGGLNCLLLKCIHIFCILGKFRMYPRRITIFFWGGGGFIPFLFFNLIFIFLFLHLSSPGRNSCDRYMTCDAVDGKHARNTKQSTPLGAVVPWALHLGGVVVFFLCL